MKQFRMNLRGESLLSELQPRLLPENFHHVVMLSLFCLHGRSFGIHFIGTDENVFHDPCHHKSHLLTHTTQSKSANRHERKNRSTHVSNLTGMASQRFALCLRHGEDIASQPFVSVLDDL